VTVQDVTNVRHVEVGLVRCNNFSIKHTCVGDKFVETYYQDIYGHDNYNCIAHGDFTDSTHYYFNIVRAGPTDGRFYAHFGASQVQWEGLGLFNPGDELRLFAWGEQVYSNTCGAWSGSGDFEGWQKFSYASTWDYLHGSADSVPLNCWDISPIDEYGDFSVSN
jgi:hypothetical protein